MIVFSQNMGQKKNLSFGKKTIGFLKSFGKLVCLVFYHRFFQVFSNNFKTYVLSFISLILKKMIIFFFLNDPFRSSIARFFSELHPFLRKI